MPLINSIINKVYSGRIKEINFFKSHPVEKQQDVLFNLLNSAKNTWFGRECDFKSITTCKEFSARVPLQLYEDFSSSIDKLMKGEKDIFWPGEVKWFAKSSGTTNDKSKFIPVSKQALENVQFRGMKDVVLLFLHNYPNSKILYGKTLTLGGSHRVNKLNPESNSFYGDLSSIILENAPFYTSIHRTPSTRIALIPEFEEKVEKIIEESLSKNVTILSGVPSWYLVLLKKVLEKTGKRNISEVWPDLEVFFHGGIKFDPYREEYKKIIPSEKMKYMETYNASEGFFAIQDDPSRNDMLLMLDYGIYYEFIPMEHFHEENPRVLSLEEVQPDVNYALVISTNGGLWRYIIGDTIRFTSTYPFRIKITGRTKHFINSFGEEVIVDNAEEALNKACELTGARISEYTAGPVFMSTEQKGAHQWIIEFNEKPDDLERFITIMDETLQNLNSDYEAKRYKSITLDRPLVTVAPEGSFYEWMKNRGKAGGQNKIPRLANDRKYLEQLLELIGNK